MEYNGLFVNCEEFGESYAGCHCTVYTSEDMEQEIDDFYIAPSELAQNPNIEEWARVKLNERYSKYAAFGYVPAMAMGGMR